MLFFFQKNLLIVLALGFLSGLPLALTASNLSVFLQDSGISIAAIGAFTLVGLPYSFKFLWAPVFDNLYIPLLTKRFGKRRAQLLFMGFFVALATFLLGSTNPVSSMSYTIVFALLLAFCSSTMDIIVDAMRIEILQADEQAAGSSMIIGGYRLGMILTSAYGLYLSQTVNWSAVYTLFSVVIMITTVLIVFFYPSLQYKKHSYGDYKKVLITVFWHPFRDILVRKNIFFIAIFIVFYKFSDAFLMSLTTPFFLDIGYSKDQVVVIVKTYGVLATIVGAFIGGYIGKKIRFEIFVVFGLLLQMVSNLTYLLIVYNDVDTGVLSIVITVENLCSGLSTAALVAYISRLCNLEFTASQYAVLSALSSFGRTSLSSGSGVIVQLYGWPIFIIISALCSLPALLVYRRALKDL